MLARVKHVCVGRRGSFQSVIDVIDCVDTKIEKVTGCDEVKSSLDVCRFTTWYGEGGESMRATKPGGAVCCRTSA